MTTAAIHDLPGVLARANYAAARADHISRHSRELIDESRRLRSGSPRFPRFFVVRGEVEGLPVRASWFCGTLRASASLAQRAQLLVDMGERFEAGDGGETSVAADLHVAATAMLTCVRACDRVRVVRFGPLETPAEEPAAVVG